MPKTRGHSYKGSFLKFFFTLNGRGLESTTRDSGGGRYDSGV